MTFAELLKRYESATPAERQQVLDLLPSDNPELTDWDAALRAVFDGESDGMDSPLADGICGGVLNGTSLWSVEAPKIKSAPDDGLGTSAELTEQGWNLVLPGFERSAHQAAASRGAKIRARTKQRDPGGMFEPQETRNLELFRCDL